MHGENPHQKRNGRGMLTLPFHRVNWVFPFDVASAEGELRPQ